LYQGKNSRQNARACCAALERYFRAFERAPCPSMPAQRIEHLTGLEARRQELAVDEAETPEPLSGEDLRAYKATSAR